MRRRSLTLLSLIALALALAAWCFVGFLFFNASASLASNTQSLSSVDAQNVQNENAAQTAALASETAAQRSALQGVLAPDVIGIANQIQSAGKTAGTQTTISSASVASVSGLPAGVTALEFVVQSDGSFAQVLQAAQLLETLPLSSTIAEFDFEQAPGSSPGSGQWQLTTGIEVLTTAQVSS